MSGMYNKLPHYVIIDDKKVIINTNYRIFIEFEQEMQGKDTKKAINKVLNRFYPAFFELKNLYLEEMVDKFIWFYKCGHLEEKNSSNKGNNKNKRPIFDYKYDDLYIWGAFKMYFNVELDEIDLHWWKFKAMWNSIPESAEFSKIKGYRGYTGDDKQILELKQFYELPLTESELEDKLRRDKLYEALK